MKRWIGALSLLGIGLVFITVAWLDNPSRDRRIDWSRSSLTRLQPQTLDTLQALKEPVLVTYYVSDRRRMPSSWRRLPDDMRQLLAAMSRASGKNFTFRMIDPTDDPELSTKLGYQHISPFDVKSIRQDAYAVNRIWSALVIDYKKQTRVIPSIALEHLPSIESKVIRDLSSIVSPERTAIALSMPWSDRGLRGMIASGAKLLNFSFESEAIPDNAQIIFLVQPRFNPENAKALKAAITNGKSVFIFASPTRLRYQGARTSPVVSVLPEPLQLKLFLDDFGLALPSELAMDIHHIAGNPSTVVIPPYSFDLSRFRVKLAGNLIMPIASPVTIDRGRVEAAGRTAEVLLHSTAMSWTRRAPESTIPWDSFRQAPGGPWARQAINLGVLLLPQLPWEGHLAVLSSAYVFDDSALRISPANFNYLRNLLMTFTAEEYKSSVGLTIEKPQTIPPLNSSRRLFWRVICLGLVPLMLFGILAMRAFTGAIQIPGLQDPSWTQALAPYAIPAGLLLLIGFWPAYASPQWDWTKDQQHRLAPESAALVRDFPSEIIARYLASPPDEFSVAGRRMMATVRQHLRVLERSSHGRIHSQTQFFSAERLQNPDVRQSLIEQRVAPFTLEVIEQDAYQKRRVLSSIVLESQGRRETVGPIMPGMEDKVEFLLDAALLRLKGEEPPRLTLIAEQPRLTPAEALMDYAQWQQPIPQSSDVYSQTRDLLRLYGYRVQTLSPKDVPPAALKLPVNVEASTQTINITQQLDIWAALEKASYGAKSPSPDEERGIRSPLLLYLQPFTMEDRLKSEIDQHLSNGGRVIAAVQHYNIQERAYRGRHFKPVYWPQPQFSRINEWMVTYGVSLVNDIVMDRSQKQATLDTQVLLGTTIRQTRRQPTSQPFLIQATPEHFDSESLVTRYLSDQLFIGPNRWTKLDSFPPTLHWKTLIATSPKAWTFEWKSGFLPDAIFAGGKALEEPQPLVVELEGHFPLIQNPRRVGEKSARMILIGCSEMFRNSHVLNDRFRASELLMNTVVDMTYSPELSRVHARASTAPQGFGYVSPKQVGFWRMMVLAVMPVLFICGGFLRKWRRK